MPLVMLKSDPRARLKPCLRCGYSLKNITDSRNCPECGLAIWISLSGNDDVEMSSPPWLRRVALATSVLAAANAALVVGVVIVQLAHAFPSLFGRTTGPFLGLPVLPGLPWFLTAYLALGGAGLALLGAGEGRYPERARTLRRTAIIAGAIAILTAAWLVGWRLTRNAMPPKFLLMIVSFGQALIGWLYLAVIARRIPSRRSERFLRALALAVAIAAATMILRGRFWFWIALIDPWSRMVIAWTLFLLLYPPAALGMLIYLAMTFHRAAAGAEKNWGKESA